MHLCTMVISSGNSALSSWYQLVKTTGFKPLQELPGYYVWKAMEISWRSFGDILPWNNLKVILVVYKGRAPNLGLLKHEKEKKSEFGGIIRTLENY